MYQRARCSDSVRAAQTIRTGCRRLRSNVMVADSPSNVSVPVREEWGVVTGISSTESG
jgi:hypothetical protein